MGFKPKASTISPKAPGISRATVYTHFSGKPEIIREVDQRDVGSGANAWVRGIRRADRVVAQKPLGGWLRRVLDRWEKHAESVKVALREAPAIAMDRS